MDETPDVTCEPFLSDDETVNRILSRIHDLIVYEGWQTDRAAPFTGHGPWSLWEAMEQAFKLEGHGHSTGFCGYGYAVYSALAFGCQHYRLDVAMEDVSDVLKAIDWKFTLSDELEQARD